MSEARKGLLLVGLVAAWAALITMRVFQEPEVQRVPLTYRSGAVAPPQTTGTPAVKRPARMDQSPSAFQPPTNIFTPIEVVQERLLAAETARQARATPLPPPVAPPPPPVTAPPPPAPEAVAAQKAREQMAQYRFLGYLTQFGEDLAFLRKGQAVFLLRAGEMVEDRIQVTTITAASVKLRHVPTRVETTLPLTPEGGTKS